MLATYSCQNIDKGQRNLKKVKSLEVGMTISDVKLIMGYPDDSVRHYFDPSKKIFIYKAPVLESENIEVWFDNNNKVERITMPKGVENQ